MAGPAYVDAFRRIVIQPDNITVTADAVDDTLTLVAGSGISLVANASSDQITIVNTNPAQFSLGVAGDDSTIKVINSGETIRFAGTQNVTVSTDAEGKVTITGPNLSAYLTSESDPVFTASAAAGINNTNISNWNSAYSWGDHSTFGYLTNNDVTIGSIRINTNVIRTVDSNADLELDASGTGAVQLRSNLKLSDGTSPDGEWTNFTPTWTASSSNPSIGDGLIEGRYKMVGKTVHVWMMMTAGSTTTFGTGEYKVSLPVPARAIASVVLSLVMYDNGTRHYNSLAHNDYTTGASLNNTSVTLFWDTGVVTNTAPFTWANGDWFIVSGTYEAS